MGEIRPVRVKRRDSMIMGTKALKAKLLEGKKKEDQARGPGL